MNLKSSEKSSKSSRSKSSKSNSTSSSRSSKLSAKEKAIQETVRVTELETEASITKKKRDAEWQTESLGLEEEVAKARAYKKRLSHIFEISSISNETPSISIEKHQNT